MANKRDIGHTDRYYLVRVTATLDHSVREACTPILYCRMQVVVFLNIAWILLHLVLNCQNVRTYLANLKVRT